MIQLEYLIVLAFVVFASVEVAIPVIRNQPLFPHLRKKTWAQRQLKRAQVRLVEAKMRLIEARQTLEAAETMAKAETILKQASDILDDSTKID